MSTRPKKPMRVPYALSVHGREEINAVVKVLKSNTALGDKTKEFEKRIAALFGKKYGCMVNSGSSANLLAFELLALPRGSEVITPIVTFSTVVAPIVQKGLIPVFCDIDQKTLQINIDQLEKAITKKTRALMIPSLIGNVPDLIRLSKIAKKHKLYLIEDSCDTLGATIGGKPTGLYSDISVTSFYGSHIINGAGGGGMICVSKPEWAERLMVLRGWGRRSSLFGEKRDSEQLKNRFRSTLGGVPYDEKFVFSEVGYNFLPLELSAAFALEQLKKLPRFIRARNANWSTLETFFKQYDKYFDTAVGTPNTKNAWLAFPFLIKQGAPFDRLQLVTYLETRGIQTRPIFAGNILKQPGFEEVKRTVPFKPYSTADYVMRHGLVLGCHQGLSKAQLAYVKKTIAAFIGQYK